MPEKSYSIGPRYNKVNDDKRTSTQVKKCRACQAAGEPFIGHDIHGRRNIATMDRKDPLRSLNLDVTADNSYVDRERYDYKAKQEL